MIPFGYKQYFLLFGLGRHSGTKCLDFMPNTHQPISWSTADYHNNYQMCLFPVSLSKNLKT